MYPTTAALSLQWPAMPNKYIDSDRKGGTPD